MTDVEDPDGIADEQAAVTSTGMSALALVVLSQLSPGDHVVVSNQLYGRTQTLLGSEAARWGVTSTLVNVCDLSAVKQAMTPHTRLIVAEAESGPAYDAVGSHEASPEVASLPA